MAGVASEEFADYWATDVCMPEMLKKFPNIKNTITVFDSEFIKACEKFPNLEDQDICLRSLKGSFFFREPSNKDLCNSQKLVFKTTEAELSRTPYKGKRPPNMSQCAFNNLVSGTLKLKQPKCDTLIMMATSFFKENCISISMPDMEEKLGVEADLEVDKKVISTSPRSTQIDKLDVDIKTIDRVQTISK